jgi:cytochrome c peroxidase
MRFTSFGSGVLTLAILGCAAPVSSGGGTPGTPFRPTTPLGLDEYYFIPDSNPLTRETVALGERLFADPILSGDRGTACASCHQPDNAFSDSVPFSRGAYGTRAARNTPTLMNRAYGRTFFWNGRAASLEEAVLQPIRNPIELNLSLDEAVTRLQNDAAYRSAFAGLFSDGATEQNLARVLASYVRTLRSGNAPVDRYYRGDEAALSADAQAGLRLFVGKANCVHCHVGPNFTDERLHNTGISWGGVDRGHYDVTGRETDRGKFKTPTLRNVALTAPYMHDGSLTTLRDVVDHYDRGGTTNPNLDHEIRPLRLTSREREQLIAFLECLTEAPSAVDPEPPSRR